MNNNHPDDDGTHKRARPDSAGTGNRTLRPPANRIRYQQPQQPQYHQNSDPLPPLPQPNYYAPPPSYNVHHGNSQPQQQYQPRLFTTYPLSNTNPTMGHNRFNNSVSLGRMMASANSVVGHNEFNNSASIMGGSVGKGGMATEMGAPSLTASINIRCNYGSECIVVDDQQKFPTFIHFMKCHRCKERNFHHPCQSEGTFLDKIIELELNYDDNRFLCGTCLFIEFPALNSKPSSRESGHGNTQEGDNTQESIEMQDEETAFLQSDLFPYNFLLEGEDEDDTSVESELAPACAWLNGESASAKNTFHKWLKKASSAGKGTKNLHPYAYLLTMAIGMDATEYDKQRVDTYTEKGWIKKMESKVTTDFLKMEVNRRYDLQTAIKDSEGGGSDLASEDESMTIFKSKKNFAVAPEVGLAAVDHSTEE